MSSSTQTYVIVGAGLAGATAAETLRREGFDGRVVLLGEELERPYDRPPLSKDYLRGEADQPPFLDEEGHYAEQRIELQTMASVVDLDIANATAVVDDGERLGYDKLLIATGAEPRRLAIPGAGLDGVLALRSLADAKAIGSRLGVGVRVVVIGAGWIGSEVAASARQKGAEVTVIEQGEVPLEGVLGSEVGAVYRDVHTERGVHFLGGSGVAAIEGAGRAERVRTTSGKFVEADLVVVGIGVLPRTALAERAGLEVDGGIIVDASLRSSAPGVYAAGDVASTFHPFYERHVRVEHWANAQAQGAAAARSMLGQEVSYEEIPYFFSDQYDVGMEYGGLATSWDEVVFRGDPKGREFIAFWVEDERVVAGMNVNIWDVNETIRDLIRSRRIIHPEQLADDSVEFSALLVADTEGAPQ